MLMAYPLKYRSLLPMDNCLVWKFPASMGLFAKSHNIESNLAYSFTHVMMSFQKMDSGVRTTSRFNKIADAEAELEMRWTEQHFD
jgi:hypothetical protein